MRKKSTRQSRLHVYEVREVILSEWVQFVKMTLPRTRKTKHWQVRGSQAFRLFLGEVQWVPEWRSYAFFAAHQSIFHMNCLRDIADFCLRETKRQREGRK